MDVFEVLSLEGKVAIIPGGAEGIGFGAPEDIAEPVAFLASEAAANITGQTLVSDGGVSIHVPGF